MKLMSRSGQPCRYIRGTASGQLPDKIQELVEDGCAYTLGHDPLVAEIAAHALDKLNLLIRRQAIDSRLNHRPKLDLVHSNESVVVDV